jgi:hypothetical protein
MGAAMRAVGIVLAVLVLGGIATFFSGLIKFEAEPAVAVCRNDDEIDAKQRDGAIAAAHAFFDRLLKGDAAAYDALATETQAKISRAAFNADAKKIIANGPYADIKVERTYEPVVPEKAARTTCGASDSGSAVEVAALPDVTQIHVVHSAQTRNTGWALTAWLLESKGAWHVRGFNVAPATIVGHDAAAFLRMADEQKSKGHAFNAHMLYMAAQSTVDRGPDLQLSIKKALDTAIAAHEPPAELKGTAPFTWRYDGASFAVEQVNLMGIDNRLGLVFLHRDPSWDGEDTGKAERRNKRLIDAFVKAHPGYADTFGFLVARLLQPGKETGWGTVFDTTKGYDTGEPSAKKPK